MTMVKHMTHIAKQLLAFVLALVLVGGMTALVGCGQQQKADDSSKAQTEQTEQAKQDDSSNGDSSTDPQESSSGNSSHDSSSKSSSQKSSSNGNSSKTQTAAIDEDGTYTSKDEVALYIHTYGKLPGNYITKSKARKAGWDSSKGNLQQVCPGMSIGGDTFKNYEGQLPEAKGRTYKECDIDYNGGRRNAKRIVFSNDGLIFYTDDHYETFEQLY